ncbi:hypothetical protein [Streptomyces sp. E5N91]|uniref:hypothetical protein n=1 Tax=Streptomyces sp. E5N91 TaxID=1851996 RepID=UPI00187D4628|nr:hypothetical protein [Streptomyces sp. E5N91]
MQRARSIFFAAGQRVAKGELFANDDPILKGREALFESVDVPEAQEPKEPEPEEPKAEEPKATAASSKPVRKAAAKKPAG